MNTTEGSPLAFARYLAARDAHLAEEARWTLAAAAELHIVLFERNGIEQASRALPDRQAAEDLANELRRDPYVRNARVLSIRTLGEDSR